MDTINVSKNEHLPAPTEIRLYLERTGWKFSHIDQHYHIYLKTIEEYSKWPVDLEVFLFDKYEKDYPKMTVDLLSNLRILEKRETANILADMKNVCLPYIGVTDVTSAEQINNIAKFFRGTGRKFQAGVMMSYKTLNGLETKWRDAWPNKEEVKNIFTPNFYVMNCLHYADYENVDVLRSLIRATKFGGQYLDAIQLDMIWPDPEDIAAYRQAFPHVKIILQVGPKAIVGYDPDSLVEKLRPYQVDYALLDASGGRGIELDVQAIRPYITAINSLLPKMNIAIAGGFGPSNIHKIKELIVEFPHLSIDAQGKLRRSGNSMDPLDQDLVDEYVDNSVEVTCPNDARW